MKACIAIVSLLISAAALAGTVSTPTSTLTPGKYALRNTDNTIPAGFTDTTSRFDTIELCDAAIKSFKKEGKWKCDLSTLVTVKIVVTNTCSDEPAPRIYLSLVDLPDGGGAKGYELPEMEPPTLKAGSDSEYLAERDWLYVRNPKGDAAYPVCWVRGWEDPTKWRQNAVKDPGKVFMELITPQNAAENTEPPNSVEPVPLPPAMQAKYDASCVDRHLQHVYYPGDTCA